MDDINDPDENGRVGEPGQAERAAEVQNLMNRARDEDDAFDSSDEAARALIPHENTDSARGGDEE